MGTFLTSLFWTVLILMVVILSVVFFIGYVELKALAHYIDDLMDEPDWFDQECYQRYCKEAFEEIFK